MSDSKIAAIPDTPTSSLVLEIASAYLSEAMLSHSRRVYLWATAYAEKYHLSYDAELLFAAAMFHDISLAPAFDSHTVSFEEASGHVARVFAAGAGWPSARRDRLGDVIVRHMWPDVDVTTDPEGHLMSRAAAMDIVGKDLDELGQSYRADVLREYPRLGLADEFLACFQDQAGRKPTSSAARAVRTGLAGRMAANPLDVLEA